MGIELNTQQVYALYDIENWWNKSNDQIYELTGSSGTGKTTLVKYFIDHIGLELHEVAFIAFMGKAAMQLARNGLPAQTAHSFIYTLEKVLDKDENGKIEVDSRGKPKMKLQFILRETLPKKVKLIVIDEASMINENMAIDILSFGIPVIALGDLNQLPPVFGSPYFLKNPNFNLTQIMRQNEGNPIVWLAQRILNDEPLQYGIYGKSSVIKKSDLNEFMLKKSDIVLTVTNKLRHEINKLFREDILYIKKAELPQIGEKIICLKNNWNRSIQDSIYLINGMTGTVEYIDIESFNGKSLKIDFKPDFLNKKFKNLVIDYKRLYSNPKNDEINQNDLFSYYDQFEYAYAITTYKSQGSEFNNVIFLDEDINLPKDYRKKLRYTAITRAKDMITIVE